mmetsp:Transcript_52750/g.58964  ORF Transcript_52750/g.58964 Transcript_52750/m.58964 type:complete len:90 (-) Transcript_52750:682-951(-)
MKSRSCFLFDSNDAVRKVMTSFTSAVLDITRMAKLCTSGHVQVFVEPAKGSETLHWELRNNFKCIADGYELHENQYGRDFVNWISTNHH